MLGFNEYCRFCSNQKTLRRRKTFMSACWDCALLKMTGLPWYWMQTELWCESPKSRRHLRRLRLRFSDGRSPPSSRW